MMELCILIILVILLLNVIVNGYYLTKSIKIYKSSRSIGSSDVRRSMVETPSNPQVIIVIRNISLL